MALTVRERFLLALGFEQGVMIAKSAIKSKNKEFDNAQPLEMAVDWMRWNEEPENLVELEKMFDENKGNAYFQDIEQKNKDIDPV